MNIWYCPKCGNYVRSNNTPDKWRIVPNGDGKRGCPGDDWEPHEWQFDHEDERQENHFMERIACDRCNVYFPKNMVTHVWDDNKQRLYWYCKSCCIDLCVDTEYINSFDED